MARADRALHRTWRRGRQRPGLPRHAPQSQRPEWRHALRAVAIAVRAGEGLRSEEHTSELQSHHDLVCRLLLEKKKTNLQPIAHRALTCTTSPLLPRPAALPSPFPYTTLFRSKWLAPTELFIELGAEAGNGQAFPGTHRNRNGPNGVTLFGPLRLRCVPGKA